MMFAARATAIVVSGWSPVEFKCAIRKNTAKFYVLDFSFFFGIHGKQEGGDQ
jgi:hypothetical protein